MYKLVIVEDERDICKRLIAMIEREETQFELVATYENGIDAYEGILTDNPDLVITDIRVPYINGIELAKKIREMLPLAKIAFITGYSEFDYAKEAANIGVLGFISKPVTQKDIDSLLFKAAEALDEEFLTAANMTRLETFYADSLPLIREHNLYLLSAMSTVPETFAAKLLHNGIDLNFSHYVTCVFDFDETVDSKTAHYELDFSPVRRFLNEGFFGLYDIELFNREDKLCMIIKSNSDIDIKKVEYLLEAIIQRVGRFSDIPMSVGVSNVCQEHNFVKMLREANRALEYRGVMGGQKVFLYSNATPITSGRLPLDEEDVKQFRYLLRYRSADESLERLDLIRMTLESGQAQTSYSYVLTSLLNSLLQACDDLEGLYARHSNPGELYRRLLDSKTADEAFSFLRELMYTVRELNDSIIVDNVELNLHKILHYIETHYRDPNISFESMASDVNFSVSYISALLKKNRNTSFIKYLTALRMENAKELLENPALKIIDIAEQLGYADPYYFSHCFKKYTGLSPKEYRSHE